MFGSARKLASCGEGCRIALLWLLAVGAANLLFQICEPQFGSREPVVSARSGEGPEADARPVHADLAAADRQADATSLPGGFAGLIASGAPHPAFPGPKRAERGKAWLAGAVLSGRTRVRGPPSMAG